MYNEPIKHQYIIECKERNQNLEPLMNRLFKYLEMYEEKLGKDASCFSLNEVIECYKYYNTTSLESLMNINSQFKLYTTWCISRNLVNDFQNHFEECTREVLQSCLNSELTKKKIITRGELLDLIEELPNVSDRFIALALFEGICGKEYSDFFELRTNAFKKEGNGYVVSLPEREITCSSTLYNYAVQSEEEYTMHIYRRDPVTHEYELVERPFLRDDDRIIKKGFTAQDSIMTSQIITRRMIRIKQYLGVPTINRTSLRDSGRVYEIQRRMKEGRKAKEIVNDEDLVIKYGNVQAVDRFVMKYGLAE